MWFERIVIVMAVTIVGDHEELIDADEEGDCNSKCSTDGGQNERVVDLGIRDSVPFGVEAIVVPDSVDIEPHHGD